MGESGRGCRALEGTPGSKLASWLTTYVHRKGLNKGDADAAARTEISIRKEW